MDGNRMSTLGRPSNIASHDEVLDDWQSKLKDLYNGAEASSHYRYDLEFVDRCYAWSNTYALTGPNETPTGNMTWAFLVASQVSRSDLGTNSGRLADLMEQRQNEPQDTDLGDEL